MPPAAGCARMREQDRRPLDVTWQLVFGATWEARGPPVNAVRSRGSTGLLRERDQVESGTCARARSQSEHRIGSRRFDPGIHLDQEHDEVIYAIEKSAGALDERDEPEWACPSPTSPLELRDPTPLGRGGASRPATNTPFAHLVRQPEHAFGGAVKSKRSFCRQMTSGMLTIGAIFPGYLEPQAR